MSETGQPQRIAVIDDAPVLRRILIALLDKTYAVTGFASGAEFLANPEPFDLVLLDIDMPEMDGYEVCRRLRGREVGSATPVIFVSGHDTAPERIEAYKAGGTDFIVKPVAADEVRHKVSSILQQHSTLQNLATRTQAASDVAFAAMTTMGELGIVMDFMRRSANCTDPRAVGEALLAALPPLGLTGAVQVRSSAGRLNLCSPEQATPLQDSVMDSLCSMGRVFVFGSRGIVNYERVSVLAVNLPTDDEARLGRIRDHLALLAEGAESRLAAIAATEAIVNLHSEATRTLDELRTTLATNNARAHSARRAAQQRTIETLDGLGRMIGTYSITDIQRETIRHTIHDALDELVELYDEASVAEADFTRVVSMLERMMQDRR